MAEDGGNSGGDSEVVVAGIRGEPMCWAILTARKRFAAVEEESDDAEAFGSGARDVGGTDVAAAGGADVLLAEDFDEEIAEGD